MNHHLYFTHILGELQNIFLVNAVVLMKILTNLASGIKQQLKILKGLRLLCLIHRHSNILPYIGKDTSLDIDLLLAALGIIQHIADQNIPLMHKLIDLMQLVSMLYVKALDHTILPRYQLRMAQLG